MRIDKFLWCCRIFKTRNISSLACKKGHVKVNNKTVKPSQEIFSDLIISVKKKQILYEFKVLSIPERRVGPKIVNLYVEDCTKENEIEKKEIIDLNRKNFKFENKPSKKDRRELKNFLNNK